MQHQHFHFDTTTTINTIQQVRGRHESTRAAEACRPAVLLLSVGRRRRCCSCGCIVVLREEPGPHRMNAPKQYANTTRPNKNGGDDLNDAQRHS